MLVSAQNDQLKSELTKKENETAVLQNQVEVLEKQTNDQKQHITLLQNQIGARDSQISLLQTEVTLYFLDFSSFLCKILFAFCSQLL